MTGRRVRRISWIACGVVCLALAKPVSAQMNAPAGTPTTRGYVQVVAQSAFGNVTTQSYGGEVGLCLRPGLFLFVEAGRVRDVSPDAFGARARAIADGVAAVAGGATVHFAQPATFGVVGPKRVLSLAGGKLRPYVLAGFGTARVTNKVDISTATGTSDQFVTLGHDLAGSETRAFFTAGGGVGVGVAGPFVIDLHYRYGRILAPDEGVNVQRAGIGIGIEF